VAPLLTIVEAQARVLERARPLEAERVRLADAAGRVTAEPAVAAVDLPPFASSAMDGFALRAGDTPGRLPVAGSIPAGSPAVRPLAPGEAMAIATGGAVPEGADAVVPVEDVVTHDNHMEVPAPVRQSANVRSRGGDVAAGEVVVPRGERLGPAQVGALAAAGVAELAVGRRPRVAVLATGSELRAPGEPLGPGQIYESNGLLLAAALGQAGARVELRGPVADEPGAHRDAFRSALEADVVVSSGGVSVGPHDLVRAVGGELGVEEVFWGVAVKPGKPVWFGAKGRTLVFGLPGNPVSSLVGLELFVRPAVLALQGVSDPLPALEPGRLAGAVRRNPARDQLLRARIRTDGDRLELDTLGGQESHMIVRAAAADALVLVPRGEGDLPAGADVGFLRLSR
jgi:molybdopterin molybdotransferase